MTFSETLNAFPALWDKSIEIRTAIINRNGFLHTIYFETRLNLDLLNSLSTDSEKLNAKSPAFKELANSFETSATLALLTGIDRRSYRRLVKLLNKYCKEPISFDKEEEETPDTVKGVLDALSFASRKIEALRRIAQISETDDTILRTINLNTRIKNIKKALIEIQQSFKKLLENEK